MRNSIESGRPSGKPDNQEEPRIIQLPDPVVDRIIAADPRSTIFDMNGHSNGSKLARRVQQF